jgi:hypothetical protein
VSRARRVVPDEPLFSGADEAIRFALSISGRAARPAMSRVLDRRASRREWTIQDQAAQAGMILNILERGGRFAMAVLTAAVAPRSSPCSCRRLCCSGELKNLEWHAAIAVIAEEVGGKGVSRAPALLRTACLIKLFGGKMSHKQIADTLDLHEATVSKHYEAIRRWLRGARARDGQPPHEGIEMGIWRAAEDALRDALIVG